MGLRAELVQRAFQVEKMAVSGEPLGWVDAHSVRIFGHGLSPLFGDNQ
jgi:hypothetical protein